MSKSSKPNTKTKQANKKSNTNDDDNKSDEKEDTNSRGIPKMDFIEDPYQVVYRSQDERYLKEVDERLGYVMNENVNKIGFLTKINKNGPKLNKFCV